MAELLDITRILELLRPHGFTPIQRVLLTWTGTLQTPLSAYFGQYVRICALMHRDNNGVIHRLAQLRAGDKVVCEADSYLNITREDVRQKVLKGKIGLGHVLETLDIRPSFKLLEIGQDETSFWRTYHLEDPGVHCRVTEVFPRELYRAEETLQTTFHEVNYTAWDGLWSWLLEAEYVEELRDWEAPDSLLASLGEYYEKERETVLASGP